MWAGDYKCPYCKCVNLPWSPSCENFPQWSVNTQLWNASISVLRTFSLGLAGFSGWFLSHYQVGSITLLMVSWESLHRFFIFVLIKNNQGGALKGLILEEKPPFTSSSPSCWLWFPPPCSSLTTLSSFHLSLACINHISAHVTYLPWTPAFSFCDICRSVF